MSEHTETVWVKLIDTFVIVAMWVIFLVCPLSKWWLVIYTVMAVSFLRLLWRGPRVKNWDHENRVVFPDGSYIVNPHYVDYHDGAGRQMDGGMIYNKSGQFVGHVDPPGPRGPKGESGIV